MVCLAELCQTNWPVLTWLLIRDSSLNERQQLSQQSRHPAQNLSDIQKLGWKKDQGECCSYKSEGNHEEMASYWVSVVWVSTQSDEMHWPHMLPIYILCVMKCSKLAFYHKGMIFFHFMTENAESHVCALFNKRVSCLPSWKKIKDCGKPPSYHLREESEGLNRGWGNLMLIKGFGMPHTDILFQNRVEWVERRFEEGEMHVSRFSSL